MSFAEYDSFEQCVSEHEGDVEDAESYCAAIHHEATGEWPGEKAAGSFETREDHLDALLTAAAKMGVEPDEAFVAEVREKAGYDGPDGSATADSKGIIERLIEWGRS